MRFANPQLLWLLLVVPVVILGLSLRYGWRRRRIAADDMQELRFTYFTPAYGGADAREIGVEAAVEADLEDGHGAA